MFLLKKILAPLVLPPGGPLLLALLGLVLARRRPRLGYSLVALAVATLWALSTPWVANELLRSLQGVVPPTQEELGTTQAIVILGGGRYRDAPEYGLQDTVSHAALERLRYGARLARTTNLPVAVTGGAPHGGTSEGEAMREALVADFGITPRWVESNSRDTIENAALLTPMLKHAGVTRITLVTHAWHMRRAQDAFERQGLSVLPAATRYTPSSYRDPLQWLPDAGGLKDSQVALHEWLGTLAGRFAAGDAQ
jgi:uncharacterized SAM-binding protein YcdF (DUF218 family)